MFERIDTSNLPQDHSCYFIGRKKIPGYFSDETDGHVMTYFVALRAKSYAYEIAKKEEISNGHKKTCS